MATVVIRTIQGASEWRAQFLAEQQLRKEEQLARAFLQVLAERERAEVYAAARTAESRARKRARHTANKAARAEANRLMAQAAKCGRKG